MNILMMTNTYLPLLGGLERSIESFAKALRKRGHRVLICAPEYEGSNPDETGVIRIPALKKFYGSKFSVKYPLEAFYKRRWGTSCPTSCMRIIRF